MNAIEEAKARCAEMAANATPRGTSPPSSIATTGTIGTLAISPSKRWSTPEAALVGHITASAEATPVGTPARTQLAAPPRIVSIAPTPPSLSPCTSRPASPPASSPLAISSTKSSSSRRVPVADDWHAQQMGSADSFAATAVDPNSPTCPPSLSRAAPSPGFSGDPPLRSALVKRGSTSGKSVRISPPQPKAPPMERRGSSGFRSSVVVSAPRRAGSALVTGSKGTRLGASTGSTASLNKGKGKMMRSDGKTKAFTKKGSAASVALCRRDSCTNSGTSVGKSSVGASGSQRLSVDSLPVPKMDLSSRERLCPQPLNTIIGFEVGNSSGESCGAVPHSHRKFPPTAATSARSPPMPATPANSQASASVVASGEASIASSLSLPTNFPTPPPPTPAQQGAHLPTTMTAKMAPTKLETNVAKSEAANDTTTPAKTRAKFFFDTIDTDEEGSLSPNSLNALRDGSARARFIGGRSREEAPPTPAPPPPSLVSSRPQSITPSGEPTPVLEAPPPVDDDVDYEEDADSDEWSSEEDEDVEQEDIFQRQARLEEAERLEKIKAEEEFKKTLFIRNPLSEDVPKIKRAGLSMLFHPELNDMHATQMPPRNQSAVELRRPKPARNASSSSGKMIGSLEQPANPRSFSNFPRPSSLVKTKSAAALPALSQGEPEMKQISPGALSRLEGTREASTKLSQSTTRMAPTQQRAPPRLAPQGAARRLGQISTAVTGTRHPSRLAAKPDDAEFSDDDSDDGEASPRPSEAQEERLAAVAARQMEVMTRPVIVGHPQSPRTMRRNMLAQEMTESVRRNLVWMRQMGKQELGGMKGGKMVEPTVPAKDDEESTYFSNGYHYSGW